MKSQKLLFLMMAFFALTLTACTKQSLNEEEEQLLDQPELIYSTGGQSDQIGGA